MMNKKFPLVLSVKVMTMINKRFAAFVQTISMYGVCELVRFMRIHHFFGYAFSFSGISIVGPVLGGDSVGFWGLCLFLVRRLVTFSITGVGLFTPLAYHIPTLFAAAYWASPSKFIRLYVPLLCMALFIVHPVGFQVPFYTMYWLIPVVLCFIPETVASKAVGSTFVAHAVGSVLWLYWLPTVPAYWYALLPVVAVERLFHASAMVLFYVLNRYASYIFQKYCTRFVLEKARTYLFA